MIYALLRAIAGVALRWYYRDIQVEGLERIPRKRPLLLVVNHPNALVDALLVGWIVPRRVLITAKSTIFRNPILGFFLHRLGVLPLQRASDAATAPGQQLDRSRNQDTFVAVHLALAGGGTVLIFPEGKTPDEPALAPLKTGAARMALGARDSGDSPGLAIVPIGLTFERKDAPRSRVFVQIGEPIQMDEWHCPEERAPAEALTDEIATRLRALTLSYPTNDDAARAVRLATMVATLFEDVPHIGLADRGLGVETNIARRIEATAARLIHADDRTRMMADQLVRRLDSVERVALKHGIRVEDVRISLETPHAARFVLRESWYLLAAGPFALWGRVNHWLPFRAARFIAMRNVESASDPAMRTILAATALVLLAYLAQTAAVTAMFGPAIGGLYLVSLPIAADINFMLSDRLRRAHQRGRAFLRFRRDPALQQRLTEELMRLRHEVESFEARLAGNDEAVA
jgi:glycerol-3-phosphate O-acyltransferase / dihydroxyacetone phosphate acyltransferase